MTQAGVQQIVTTNLTRSRALARAGRLLAPPPTDKTRLGVRRGQVAAITTVSVTDPEPFYTVTVDGVNIPDVRSLSTCGPQVGDGVMMLRSGPDWIITGIIGPTLHEWDAAITTSGTQQPAIGTGGSLTGYYIMIGPTTMQLHVSVVFGSSGNRGSGAYSIGNLPKAVLYDQSLSGHVQIASASPTPRFPVCGLIQQSRDPNLIFRIVPSRSDVGSSGNPYGLDDTIDFGTGGYFQLDGTLQVQP